MSGYLRQTGSNHLPGEIGGIGGISLPSVKLASTNTVFLLPVKDQLTACLEIFKDLKEKGFTRTWKPDAGIKDFLSWVNTCYKTLTGEDVFFLTPNFKPAPVYSFEEFYIFEFKDLPKINPELKNLLRNVFRRLYQKLFDTMPYEIFYEYHDSEENNEESERFSQIFKDTEKHFLPWLQPDEYFPIEILKSKIRRYKPRSKMEYHLVNFMKCALRMILSTFELHNIISTEDDYFIPFIFVWTVDQFDEGGNEVYQYLSETYNNMSAPVYADGNENIKRLAAALMEKYWEVINANNITDEAQSSSGVLCA